MLKQKAKIVLLDGRRSILVEAEAQELYFRFS